MLLLPRMGKEITTSKKKVKIPVHSGHYEFLVQEAKDYAIMILNTQGTIVSWNKGGENLFGYTEPEILGKNFSILFIPEDRELEKPRHELQHTLETGQSIDENWALKKDGSRFWASGISAVFYDRKRKLKWLSKIVRDITKQREYEQSKDEFIGIVSHELKTPVTSIKAFLQVMQSRFEKEGNEKSVVLLSKMDAQINKLTALIGDLLDVTKIEGGKLQFHEEHFLFDNIVTEIVEELQRTTEKHKIIKKGFSGKIIFGDKTRIGQVITNLLTNAIKYSPHATKIIVQATTNGEGGVKLSVQDFGIGIPKTKQKRIFERFYRVGGEQSHTFAGLGIGLYLAAEIIKRQGGDIGVESEEGKGSIFFFSLPIKGSKGKRQQENTFIEEEIKHE